MLLQKKDEEGLAESHLALSPSPLIFGKVRQRTEKINHDYFKAGQQILA